MCPLVFRLSLSPKAVFHAWTPNNVTKIRLGRCEKLYTTSDSVFRVLKSGCCVHWECKRKFTIHPYTFYEFINSSLHYSHINTVRHLADSLTDSNHTRLETSWRLNELAGGCWKLTAVVTWNWSQRGIWWSTQKNKKNPENRKKTQTFLWFVWSLSDCQGCLYCPLKTLIWWLATKGTINKMANQYWLWTWTKYKIWP